MQRSFTMQKYLSSMIRSHAEKYGIKLTYISNQVGVDIKRLSHLLDCKRHITAEEFINICQYLGIDPRTIYNNTHSA